MSIFFTLPNEWQKSSKNHAAHSQQHFICRRNWNYEVNRQEEENTGVAATAAVVWIKAHWNSKKSPHDSEAWLSFSYCLIYTCAISFYIICCCCSYSSECYCFSCWDFSVEPPFRLALCVFPLSTVTHLHMLIFSENMQSILTHFFFSSKKLIHSRFLIHNTHFSRSLERQSTYDRQIFGLEYPIDNITFSWEYSKMEDDKN